VQKTYLHYLSKKWGAAHTYSNLFRRIEFKIGVMLRQAREAAGLTQEIVAKELQTTKSAISRLESHAENVRLSTLRKYAQAIGKSLHIQID
ncbi:MAG: helix-turn-helix transcriptional regulator, partial [Ignavibacteria bacterium]|nr:helix-turn-helix transcriptional regulator [Ignavibacteria bacterium]